MNSLSNICVKQISLKVYNAHILARMIISLSSRQRQSSVNIFVFMKEASLQGDASLSYRSAA